MHPMRPLMTDPFHRFRSVLTLSGYLRSSKRLAPGELRAVAGTLRRGVQDVNGNTERVAAAIESVAAWRAASASSAMKRDAPATTLFERLSDWATASF
jgi:hypothetical protein